MRVLISEDDPSTAQILQLTLQKAGYDVVVTRDGKEAWQELQRDDPPKLVILDWMMPRMSGFEVCRNLRANHENIRTYVIFLTVKRGEEDISAALGAGADDYISKPFNKAELLARLRVGERAIKRQHQLEKEKAQTEQLFASISSILIGIDEENCITRWNSASEDIFGIQSTDVLGRPFLECGIKWDWKIISGCISSRQGKDEPIKVNDVRFTRTDGKVGFLHITVNPMIMDNANRLGYYLLGIETTERKTLESQLVQAQKLESIGQLAAGIAHEINTPTQFVGDNTYFLQTAFEKLKKLLSSYENLLVEAKGGDLSKDSIQRVDAAVEESRINFLCEEIPKALEEAQDGISRISTIVRAMKDFSHPPAEEKTLIDLNKAIETTITVARNEWKYVAEMVTDFDSSLQQVPCHVGEFNQAILNMIVNAAHAISDFADNGNKGKGTITISTRQMNDYAEICICDTGTGIPKSARGRIFDPFFTTKEVGSGTGQGLAIAHSVVTQKHGGSIIFDTEIGKGTTFIIRLPINGKLSDETEAL
jgi:PAS domain S-box-containing protein